MRVEEEIPENLRGLVAELDALGGSSSGPEGLDGLPDLSGTDFVPLAEIGRGGMGVVYEAKQISLDRSVAVKVLSPYSADNASFRSRFAAEARLVARLHHPNIVDIYAAGSANGHIFFAMELISGKTAQDHVFPSLAEVVQLGAMLADALDYAHACGVVHRDVKPTNVFLESSGVPKLGDFGLACLVDGEMTSAGTRKYMAPECADGGAATPQSDQYALGATLLELATPFLQNKPNRDLSAILDKATCSLPDARYPDLGAFASDLRRFLAGEPVTARPPSVVRRIGLWSRRNPSACLGAVCAIIGLVGFIVALAVGYVHTRQALAETERARKETQQALLKVEEEAGRAAQSLATTLSVRNRPKGDFRADEIARALATVEALAERFPDNAEIKSALGKLRYAKEAHARVKARRGGGR